MSEFETPGSEVSKAQLAKKLPVTSTSAPDGPSVGDVWIDSNPYVPPVPTTVAATPPSSAAVGDVWIDTNPYPKTTVGAVAPSNPSINDVWIDIN